MRFGPEREIFDGPFLQPFDAIVHLAESSSSFQLRQRGSRRQAALPVQRLPESTGRLLQAMSLRNRASVEGVQTMVFLWICSLVSL